jgi:hypothetical protein
MASSAARAFFELVSSSVEAGAVTLEVGGASRGVFCARKERAPQTSAEKTGKVETMRVGIFRMG